MTGAPAFFDSSAGITIETAPAPLLPNPPPQYSLIKTTFDASMPSQPASGSTVRATLWVDPERRAHGRPRAWIDRARDALGRPVQVHLAVLPVRHRATRFHRLWARRL